MPDTEPAPASADAVSETDLILNLGNPDAASSAPARHIDPRWSTQYQGLKDFRDYLLDQLNDLKTEARGVQPDVIQDTPAESGTSDLMRDYLLGMSSTEQATLYEVDDAIRRIEESRYGVCERTGQPIPAARLRAVPWARFTVDAQAQAEHANQAAVHASLGTLPNQPAPPDLPSPVTDDGREVGGPAPEGTENARLSGRD